MFATEEVYEDVTEAMWLGLTPAEAAEYETQLAEEMNHQATLSEWEAYTLREIEARLSEEEEEEVDNFQLLPC